MATKRKRTPKQKKAALRYRAVRGAHLSNRDANLVGCEYERLFKQHGMVQAKRFLKEAKRSTSPVHHLYPWDVRKAAENHWLERTYYLLRSFVKVTYRIINPPPQEDPRGTYVPMPYVGRGYDDIEHTAADPDLRAQMRASCLRELGIFLHKYQILTEFADLFAQIRNILGLGMIPPLKPPKPPKQPTTPATP